MDARERAQINYEIDQNLNMMKSLITETNPQVLLGKDGSQADHGLREQFNREWLLSAQDLIKAMFKIGLAKGMDTIQLVEEQRSANAARPQPYDQGVSGLRHPVGSPVDGHASDLYGEPAPRVTS